MFRGFVIPVVKYIKKCWDNTDTDVSLIRYFVTEVLDTIAPPYSQEFVSLFLPLVENEEIVGGMEDRRQDAQQQQQAGGGGSHGGGGGGVNADEDPVSEFVVHCRANFSSI